QFFAEYMQPFVETRGGWSNKTVDNYSLGFSSAALAQLQRAASIRNIFFRESKEVPSVSLELRPYSMDKNEARFSLDMGEERLTYSHGPKFWKSITWSGDSARRIRIIFEDLNNTSFDRAYSGPWAWFRLMDDAEIKAASQSNIYWITFRADQGSSGRTREIVFEGKASSVHNPFKNELLSLFRCPESI